MTSARHASNPSLREAEGYLDLLIPPAPHFRMPRELRIPLAQRALTALDHACLAGNWSAHAYFLRGQALRIMERYADAVQPLRQAAELDPEDQHVRLALAWYCLSSLVQPGENAAGKNANTTFCFPLNSLSFIVLFS